jgi:hypothetical protein
MSRLSIQAFADKMPYFSGHDIAKPALQAEIGRHFVAYALHSRRHGRVLMQNGTDAAAAQCGLWIRT